MSATNYTTTTETKNLRPLSHFVGQTRACFIIFPNGGSAYVRGEVCQRIELGPAQPQLMVGVDHACGRDDQMGFQCQLAGALKQSHTVHRTARACDPDDQAAPGGWIHWSSSCCSSPDWYISIMMSEPPTNSPAT